MKIRTPAPLLLAILLFASMPALAHDFWLEPSDGFRPAAGDIISLRMFVGEAFRPEQELPPVSERITRLEVVSSSGKFDITPEGRRDILPAIALSDPGTFAIAMEREPSFITLDAEKFNSYLEEEGHHAIVSARLKDGSYGKPGRERYTRHLKMILSIGESTEAWSHQFGTKLEIVPLADPAGLRPGSRLPLRVLFEGKPLAGARVGVVSRQDGTISREKMVRTDRSGNASVTVDSGGDFLVRTTWMRPCAKCNDADYESFWSAMTFAVAADSPAAQ
jgi:uncharacterized GH25 family protein